MQRLKVNARMEYEYLENFKVLQKAFAKHRIDKPIPVEKLVKYVDCRSRRVWWTRAMGSPLHSTSSSSLCDIPRQRRAHVRCCEGADVWSDDNGQQGIGVPVLGDLPKPYPGTHPPEPLRRTV